MTFKATTTFTLLALTLTFGVQQASAQMGMSGSKKEMIHMSLLKCYEGLGNTKGQAVEYVTLLAMRPSDGVLHYNYGQLLQTSGQKLPALAQFKAAAQYSPGNVEIQGTYGTMLLNAGRYQEAYNKLGAAMQMPGGEKYQAGFKAAQAYLQQQLQQRQINAQNAPGPASKAGPGAKKHSDDDDE